jgi:methionyl-tRNA formyltransferase
MKSSFFFFGTPRFAEIALSELINKGWVPSRVICNPDRPAGRKKELTAPPVKTLAENNGIPVFQPERLSHGDSAFRDIPDYFFVAAYGKIIPRELFEIPRFGTIGIHPSLLPQYRGASPIQSAILNGEEKTGITIFLIDEQVDHGKILAQETVSLSTEETYSSLEEKLARLGSRLLMTTAQDYREGKIIPKEQDHVHATVTKKISTKDGFISADTLNEALQGNAEKTVLIDRMVRALNPEPGVWTLKDGKRMKILGVKKIEGKIIITRIQMEGGVARDIL